MNYPIDTSARENAHTFIADAVHKLDHDGDSQERAIDFAMYLAPHLGEDECKKLAHSMRNHPNFRKELGTCLSEGAIMKFIHVIHPEMAQRLKSRMAIARIFTLMKEGFSVEKEGGDLSAAVGSIIVHHKSLLQNEVTERIRWYEELQQEISYQKSSAREHVSPSTEILNRHWRELNLSPRVRKACVRAGMETIGDLASKSAGDWLGEKNFGVTCLEELRNKLATLGVKLKGD